MIRQNISALSPYLLIAVVLIGFELAEERVLISNERDRIERILGQVVDHTHGTLRSWAAQHVRQAEALSRTPELARLSSALID